MNRQPASDKLLLGIAAARMGRQNEARSHFVAVLKQHPENITAMLWLAFVLPSPRNSLRVLERVLVLDPENKQARSGIRWVKERSGLEATAPISETTHQKRLQPKPVSQLSDKAALPGQTPRKSTSKRTRRSKIEPRFLLIAKVLPAMLLVGLMGLTIGLGIPVFASSETLAAWWPGSSGAKVSPPTIEWVPLSQPLAARSMSTRKNLATASDTLTLQAAPVPVVSSNLLAEHTLDDEESSLHSQILPSSDFETANFAASVDPSVLIGPVLPVDPSPVEPDQLAHQPTYPGEKWIEVNVTTQEVTAWEGNVPVLSFISSTGLPRTPTVLGKYNIYWKLEKTLMTGPGYYLPNVPYTMYFFEGYALHGTYWHNNFGQPMSRGCVNLSEDNAKNLFEWANPVIPPGQTAVWASADNPGTLVVVHD